MAHLPAYCLHKATGQAVVRLNGRDHYLGKFGTEESRQKYDGLIAEWLANGRKLAEPESRLLVGQLIERFLSYAQTYYKKRHGSSGYTNARDSMKPVFSLYSHLPADLFGVMQLKAVRQKMIDSGLAYTTVNDRVNWIRRGFRWAASEGLLDPIVWERLKALPGLKRGRSAARNPEPIRQVAVETVEKTLPYVQRSVAGMIRMQLLTAMRPGEVCMMRGIDINTSEVVWVYRPTSHKTEHHGKDRQIYLGPRAVQLAKEYLTPDLTAPLFPTDRGEFYRQASYYNAIRRVCQKHGIPHWTPNQLRHTAATRIRRSAGVEVARILLGHSDVRTTELYAERDRFAAIGVVQRIG